MSEKDWLAEKLDDPSFREGFERECVKFKLDDKIDAIRREAWREGARAMRSKIAERSQYWGLWPVDRKHIAGSELPRFPTSWPPKRSKK